MIVLRLHFSNLFLLITVITMLATYGIGSMVSSLKLKVSPKMKGTLDRALGGSFSAGGVVLSTVKEVGQELLMDPWIESTVSGLVRRAGGNAMMQMILSSIAESGREALSGPLSSLFSSSSSQQSESDQIKIEFDKILDSNYYSKGLKPTIQEYLAERSALQDKMTYSQTEGESQTSILRGASKVLSFISLATGFAASFLLGPVGPLLFTTLTTYLASGGDFVKSVFKQVFNPIVKTSQKIGSSIRKNHAKIITALGVGVLGTVIGISTAAFLSPFFGSILGTVVGGISGPVIAYTSMMSGMISTDTKKINAKRIVTQVKTYMDTFNKKFNRFDLKSELNDAIDLMKEHTEYFVQHSIHVLSESQFSELLMREHKGIIYIVWRVLDENGNRLAIPQPYVGLTTQTARIRFNGEIDKARQAAKGVFSAGPNDRYISTMASYLDKNGKPKKVALRDAFKLEVVDICYSELELGIKEAFYTEHYDSDNPDVGLNYYRGPPEWQWKRSQGGQKVITKEMLVNLLLEDFSFKDFATNPTTKDLPNSEGTIRTLIEKYIFDEDGNPVSGTRQAKIELVRPLLKEAISKGLDRESVLEYFADHGATILQKRSLSNRRYAGIDTFSKQVFEKNFDKCREELYIQPLIGSLVRRGAYIPGLDSPRVSIEDLPDLIEKLRRTKNRIGSGNDLGLIEILMIEGVQGRELTKALGLWQEGDSESVKWQADSDLMVYIRHRWGFNFDSEAQLREYLFILYLTRSW